jgi:lipid-binding SYLF domain-containing protein
MKKSCLCKIRKVYRAVTVAACGIIMLGTFSPGVSHAATAEEIDAGVNDALVRFQKEVKGGKEFLQKAKGVLVFPKVYKGGFIIGGEYGQGALRIGGKTVDYYSTAGGSFGFQIGGQAMTVIIAFMQDKALQDFRASSGWEVGVDGSVALITVGGGESVNSETVKDPIVGFVFDNKGLMFNISLAGSKFTKIKK